jgi:parallel beta-helix repeat protein
MGKIVNLICIELLITMTVIPILDLTHTVNGGNPPPPDDNINGTQYIDGDWEVTGNEIYTNETIILTGNLIIKNSGILTFNNVTLKMNSTDEGDNEFRIEVENGGEFYIYDYDDDNTTFEDASVITNNTNKYFLFDVYDGGKLVMKNSELSGCRYKTMSSQSSGIHIYSDDVLFDHNIIRNNYLALLLLDSSATISNNTITNNDRGIYISGENPLVFGNYIVNSPGTGIFCIGSATPLIDSNILISNGWAAGISVFSSSPMIINTTIMSSSYWGIQVGGSASTSTPMVINSTITGSVSGDVWLDDGAQLTLLNTQFDESSVTFDSGAPLSTTLTVQWYLHMSVESAYGLPISGASVNVTNITDDPIEGSPFITGDDGFVRWIVVTERIQNPTSNVVYTPHNVTVTVGDITGYADPEPVMDSSKVITVILDIEKPIADAGMDTSVDEDEPYTFDSSGSVACVGIINWTWDYGDGTFGFGKTPNHTYTSSGFYVVVLNVTDAVDIWDTDTIDIFVNNVPPIADAGDDKVEDEGGQINFDGSNSIDTASDINSLFYRWDFGDGTVGNGKIVSQRYEDNGTYTVTLQVTDDDGATSVNSINVTVNNTAPRIEPIAPQFLQEDQLYTLQVIAIDVQGDTLTFSDNTTMFDIDPVTGVISFTPTNADGGTHLVNLTVVDDDGAESYIEIQMDVQNTSDAPIITSSPITIAVENSTYYYNLTVRDDDLDVITYGLDLKPEGMSTDSNGRIAWTPTYQQASQTFMVIVNVSDGNDFDTQTFSITVMNVNDKPAITSTPILSATEDAQYLYDVNAVDVDIRDWLIYSLDTAPIGMNIDSSTGLITWAPTNDQVGDNEVKVNVTDSMGVFVTQGFTITVANSNDAPVLGPVGPLLATEGRTFSYIATAVDIDVGDTLTFSDDTDLFDINSTTGNITFVPSNDDVGIYTIKITVTDSDGAIAFENVLFTVNNVNNPPILPPIDSQTLTEDVSFILVVTATDIDVDDTLIFIDNTTLFDINPYNGEISFTPINEDVGTYLVNITVKDEGGGIAYQTVNFTVNNVNDPPLIDLIEGLTMVASKPFSYTVGATDVDYGDTLTFSDDTELFNIDPDTGEISFTPTEKNAGVHYVTITVTDGEGESDQMTLTFNILGRKGQEPFDFFWILLLIIVGLAAFFIGNMMRGKGEIGLPEEKEEDLEPEEIEMELLEEEKPPEEENGEELEKAPPSSEEEESVEFEVIEEEAFEPESEENEFEGVDDSHKDEPVEFETEDEAIKEKNISSDINVTEFGEVSHS